MKLLQKLAAFLALSVGGVTLVQADQIESTDGIFPHVRSNLPKKKNATAGKYLYIGVAPTFKSEDLKMVSSKVGLTLRVTGSVTQEFKDQYALQLFKRFKKIAEVFLATPEMKFHPLVTFASLEAKAKQTSTKLWLKVASSYAHHVLDGYGLSIEDKDLTPEEYKKNILTLLLRYYFQNQGLVLESLPLLETYFQNADYVRRLSNDLFQTHLGNRFTAVATVDEKTQKSYIGTLTYVYPIAATTEGPFDQPREGVRGFGLEGNIESRIWSEKWDDEFGGMPFLLVEWSGVAFHGPITNYAPLDIWYLRRDYVSHGCHRMDSSDIMELRSILPANLSQLGKIKKQIQHVTLSWPDVTDWNNDGQLEVMDVGYYEIPTWFPTPKKDADLDVVAQKYTGDNARISWRRKHYIRYNKHKDAQGTPIYDAETGLYTGLPHYEVVKGKLVRNGVHPALPVVAFPYQANRIIQYDDGKPMPKGFDNRAGKTAPPSFLPSE